MNPLLTTHLAMIGAGLAAAAPLWAQTAEAPEDEPAVREEITVTAQFTPESAKDSLYRVRVFDRARIEAQAADNLRELLGRELTLDIDQHSVFGSGLSIDGVSGENVKILVDGAPVVGRLNGIVDLAHIDLDSVRQVELIEGPVSVYYGADALAGVVNLITETPRSQGLRGRVSGGWESAGDWRRTAAIQYAAGRYALGAHFGGRDFDGFDADPADRGRDWNQRRQKRGGLTLSRRFDGLTLAYRGRFMDERLEDRGEPRSGQAVDAAYHTERTQHGVWLNGEAANGLYLDLSLAFADYARHKSSLRIDLDTGLATPNTGPNAADFTGFRRWQGRGLATARSLAPGLDAQLGWTLAAEEGQGARLGEDRRRVEDWAVFAGLRFEAAPGLAIQPALRYNRNSVYDAPAVPALHLKYDPGEQWTWRASYAQGFRGPSIKELYLDFVMPAGPFLYHIAGNDALAAEQGHNGQLGLQFQSPAASGSWQAEASLYVNDIDDLIALSDLAADPQNPRLRRRQYINVDESQTRGGRLEVRFHSLGWRFGAGLARAETANRLAETDPVPGFRGTWRANASLTRPFWRDRATFSAFYKYQGARAGFVQESGPNGQAVTRETRLAAYHQLDAGLTWRLRPDGLTLQGGVKNLFDAQNQDEAIRATGQAHETHRLGYGRVFYANARWSW